MLIASLVFYAAYAAMPAYFEFSIATVIIVLVLALVAPKIGYGIISLYFSPLILAYLITCYIVWQISEWLVEKTGYSLLSLE